MPNTCPGCMAPLPPPSSASQTSVTCAYCGRVVPLQNSAVTQQTTSPPIVTIPVTASGPYKPLYHAAVPEYAISTKSRTVALILVILVGVFGAQRFYTGRTKSAVIMLILTCTVYGLFVTVPWEIIDFIQILMGTFSDRDGGRLKVW